MRGEEVRGEEPRGEETRGEEARGDEEVRGEETSSSGAAGRRPLAVVDGAMRAVVCRRFAPVSELTVEEVDEPTPARDEVLIDIHAAGVNFPDVLIVQGKYQARPGFPFIPGGEVAGVVRSVGAGVRDLAPGDPVFALCGVGGFAERVAVVRERVVKLDPRVDLRVAGGFVMTYATSLYALKDRARLAEGETLLVLGAAGGVGLAAVELGKRLGARVIAAASSAEKLELCAASGADLLLNYGALKGDDGRLDGRALKGEIRRLSGAGVDVTYDPVGG
ncbi:MAG: zinc-binding dehydrogenase, partial [Myxococcales bacterium]|nr:zinc-binding dehydrogenase [Myxococcales bacterium]